MKKLILLLSLCLISVSVALSQSLATEIFSEANMNLPGIGTNFNVPIHAEEFPDNLRYVEFFFEYDPTVIHLTGYANKQNESVNVWITSVSSTILKISYTATPPFTFNLLPSGKLLDLQFDFYGGNSPLNLLESFGGQFSRFRVGSTITNITELTSGAVLGGTVDNIIVSGNWETPLDWSLEVVPNAFHNVFIQGFAVVNNDASCNDLTIETTGRLTAQAGSSLVVNGDMLIDGDETSTGSFANYGDPLSLEATVKQYMTGGNWTGGNNGNWHLVGIPVDGFTPAEVFFNCVLQYWDESTPEWVSVPEPFDVPFAMHSPMMGYSVAFHGSEDKMLEFNGTLNDGSFTIQATHNNNLSGNVNWDTWNLIGNPFPSAIDVDGPGWTRDNVSHGVAYWDETIENWRYFGAGVPGNGGSQFIPPMQGFFVKATNPGVGTIGVSNAARAHTDQFFYKSDPANTLRLLVQNGSFTDEAVIRFMDEASANYDERYDFFKLFVQNVPQIYSITGNNEALAISALPVLDEDNPVNIGFKPGVNASMAITAGGIETFDSSLPIWLYDHVEDIHWNLRENPVYNFVANTDDDENRFSIHFKNFTGVPGLDQPQVNIYAFNRQLFVDAGSGNPGEIVVVNILGQELVRSRMTENLNVVSLPVSNSYVVVKVISDKGITTRKVYVN